MAQFRIAVLAALFAGLLTLSAGAQTTQNWTIVHSRNFDLIGDASEAEIRSAALRLEEFRQAFGRSFPTLKLNKPGTRTNMVVFKNEASYRPFKPKRPNGAADDHVAGYFQAGDDTNYITLSIPEASAERYATVFHEYVHFLIDANFGADKLPVWLNEGLAEYFETLRMSGGRFVLPGGPRRDHLSLLRRSTPIPLSTLFATDNRTLHSGGDELRSLFYAESWAVVQRLVTQGARTDAEMFENVFSLMTGSSNPERSVREAFGSTDAEFEKELLAFAARPPLPVAAVTQPEISSSGELSARPMTAAEFNAYLGDLLYHTDRWPEAVQYLRRSLVLDPRQPLAHASLGLLLMKQKKYAEAKPHLETAAASAGASAYLVFNYAYSLVCEVMDADGEVSELGAERRLKIEQSLRRAIELEPDFAESYRLLAFVRMVDGENLDEAAEMAKKASGLDPANDEHSLLIAQIYLKQEKYRDAYDLADRLAALTADPRIRADARTIVTVANEYFSANAKSQKTESSLPDGTLPPLVLKRSAVSDAEIAKIEEDRKINNLNRILSRPKAGEKQIVAYVDRILCLDDSINYTINAGGQRSVFRSKNFADLRLSVITEGQRTFQLECGAAFGKQLTVLTFRPPAAAAANWMPELVSITFVPDIFRLKTAEEMAKVRIVVVEDDLPKRSGGRKSDTSVVDQ